MKTLFKFSFTFTFLFTIWFSIALTSCTGNQDANKIVSVAAITEVFGNGQRTIAAAVEYGSDIDQAKLPTSAFFVQGRTITKVYANTEASVAPEGKNGRYVIIELAYTDKNAPTFLHNGTKCSRIPARVRVKQLSDLVTAHGETCAADAEWKDNSKQVNLVVDDFQQLEYKDPGSGKILKYNLFVPKNYDKTKTYPMVMFIHDMGVCSDETTITLVQGHGAIIWATPFEQAKHPCFVLAPQYPSAIVNDNSEMTIEGDITADLIKSLEKQYTIDTNRVYATGQSMGCMASIAMNIKYPDLFAASLLVAGQWDPAKVQPLAKDKLWIIVSEGDTKAFPGMNTITLALEKAGAKISKASWDGRSADEDFKSEVDKMIAEPGNIKYTVLEKGTVVPPGMQDDGGNNHICSWWIAYTIEGIRDWLFAQKK